MLSRAETTKIKEEIKLMEAALPDCHDSGLKEVILLWIGEWKKQLPKQRRSAKEAVGRSQAVS
jgi:hypothetical protein